MKLELVEIKKAIGLGDAFDIQLQTTEQASKDLSIPTHQYIDVHLRMTLQEIAGLTFVEIEQAAIAKIKGMSI